MKPRPDPDVPAAARLFADPSRAQILEALLDAPRTPGELARIARVSAPTITSHLGRLDEAGLITRRGGRVELAGDETPRLVADALEALARLAPFAAALAPGARRIAAELRAARSCYDHLAGRLGVAVTEALVARRVLDGDLQLTTNGHSWLADQGLALAAHRDRPLTRACMDWSERRPHVAGALGATLLDWLRDEGWVLPIRDSRALRVSDRGARALRERLGIEAA